MAVPVVAAATDEIVLPVPVTRVVTEKGDRAAVS
jgi:hypothetical protein